MNMLLIDNYDSFTYNLAMQVYEITGTRPVVKKNDKITIAEVAQYHKILLSPGPGVPADAGLMQEIIHKYAPTKSILGICLGHQAIGEVFGASLLNLAQVHHGVSSFIAHTGTDSIYEGLDTALEVGRYHSWVVAKNAFPACLEITAEDEHGEIMSLKHREYDVRGLQFHPESILTPMGRKMMENWVTSPGPSQGGEV